MEKVNKRKKIERLLVGHEGWKNKLYKCPAGKWTIGVGRNLEANPLKDDEVYYLLQNDLRLCQLEAENYLKDAYTSLDEVRKAVIVSMIFNLGIGGFVKFKRTINAIERKDFVKAAEYLLQSKVAREQAPKRYKELAKMLETGEWPSWIR